jgi:hypothetical protein
VSLSTTVKTVFVVGNDLVAVLKRPSEETADRNHVPGSTEGEWHPDPMERHEKRWWDGAQWTEHVQDGVSMSSDPLPDKISEH